MRPPPSGAEAPGCRLDECAESGDVAAKAVIASTSRFENIAGTSSAMRRSCVLTTNSTRMLRISTTASWDAPRTLPGFQELDRSG